MGELKVFNRIMIPWGQGEMIYKNQISRYNGEWVNGDFHGKGTLFERNRVVYNGSFKKSEKDGFGEQQVGNGTCLRGLWRNNRLTYPLIFITADNREIAVKDQASLPEPASLNPLRNETRRLTQFALTPAMQRILNSQDAVREAIIQIEHGERSTSLYEFDTNIHKLLLLEEIRVKEQRELTRTETNQRNCISHEAAQSFKNMSTTEKNDINVVTLKAIMKLERIEKNGRVDIENKAYTFFEKTAKEQKLQRIAIDPEAFKSSCSEDEKVTAAKNCSYGAVGKKEHKEIDRKGMLVL